MKYLSATFSYLRKNFLLPVIAMIIPAVAACLLSTPYMQVAFVTQFDYPYISASETFLLMFGDSWKYVWPVLLISVLQTVAASLIMSAIDRQFRTGTLSFKSPIRLLNYSIFPIALGVFVMCVVSILFRFVLFGLVMLVQVSFSAMHVHADVALAVISVLAAGVFVIHVLAITSMLYWAPSMFIYGYKFRDAVASSIKLISGKRLFVGLLIPMMICALIQLLVGFLHVHVAVGCVVNFAVYLFTNVYTTVYVILSFYMISGLERRDIPMYMIPLPVPPPSQKSEEKIERSAPETGDDQAAPNAPEQKPDKKKKSSAKKPQSGESGRPRASEKSAASNKPEKTDGKQKNTAEASRAEKTKKTEKPKKSAKSEKQKKPEKQQRSQSVKKETARQDGEPKAERGEGGGDVV